MAVLVIVICVFNVVMWIAFIAKFRKLFSADDVISSAKSSLDRIIKDIDSNVYRNVTIINNSISRLQSINSEVEKKIKLLNEMEKNVQNMNQFNSLMAEKNVKKNSSKSKNQSDLANLQGDLFESEESVVEVDIRPLEKSLKESSIFDSGEDKPITYSAPKNYISGISAAAKANLKNQIVSFYNKGQTIEEIAEKLNCTATEVQLALSLEGLI